MSAPLPSQCLEHLVLPLPTVTLCDGATGRFGFIYRRLPQPPPPFIFLPLLAAVAVTARCEAPWQRFISSSSSHFIYFLFFVMSSLCLCSEWRLLLFGEPCREPLKGPHHFIFWQIAHFTSLYSQSGSGCRSLHGWESLSRIRADEDLTVASQSVY